VRICNRPGNGGREKRDHNPTHRTKRIHYTEATTGWGTVLQKGSSRNTKQGRERVRRVSNSGRADPHYPKTMRANMFGDNARGHSRCGGRTGDRPHSARTARHPSQSKSRQAARRSSGTREGWGGGPPHDIRGPRESRRGGAGSPRGTRDIMRNGALAIAGHKGMARAALGRPKRPATSCGAGKWCPSRGRSRARQARPGRDGHKLPGSSGGGGIWQTGSYRSATQADDWGHRPIRFQIRSGSPRQGRQSSLPTTRRWRLIIGSRAKKLVWYFQSPAQTILGLRRRFGGSTCSYDATVNGETAKGVGPFARKGSSNGARPDQRQLYVQGRAITVLQRSELDLRASIRRPGKPFEYDPKLDVRDLQPRAARALGTATGIL